MQELTAERDGLARLNMGSPEQAATESERPSGPPPAASGSELALLARGLPSDWSAVPCATGQGRFFYRNASLGLAQWLIAYVRHGWRRALQSRQADPPASASVCSAT